MTGSGPYARRRYLNSPPPTPTAPYLPPLHTHNDLHRFPTESLSLTKSATFHSPTSPSSSEDDPILNIRYLPRRSSTCPKALEDAVAAGEKRAAHLLGAVDRSLSGLENFTTETQDTLRTQDLPVPRFMLDAHVGDLHQMNTDPTLDRNDPHQVRKVKKHHTSDSGIGSTVTGSEQSSRSQAGICALRSGINGNSVSLKTSENGSPHALSEYACRQIQKHIINPIVRENSLKDFHPLVRGIPYRVGRKEITCLRDLEKVLLWLAPKWTVSKSSFIQFCETSIQCLHTTVDHLSESDQRRPADRPYTNGYFLDLTEQVRQYAEMITASRERMAAGRRSSGDFSPDERLGLHGGLSQTGQPAQLVRIRDGKSISLRTGEEVKTEPGFGHRPENSMSMELDDDIQRSMARRRKSEQNAIREQQKCKECDKLFKRPCDLTKHEKTHSRPWKCTEPSCKYHQHGWPTEKERDRHVNDKHSSTPSMYKCRFHPCPYESKRESNCKQHMEKAHGWAYIRSKNNGKNGKKAKSTKTPPTPQLASPTSNIFDASSPDFSAASDAYNARDCYSVTNSVDGSVAATPNSTTNSSSGIPFMAADESFRPLDPIFDWDHPYTGLASPGRSDTVFNTHQFSWDQPSTTNNAQAIPSPFETSLALQDQELLFSNNFDWSNMNTDFTSYNMQLITPATSVSTRPLDGFSRNPSFSRDNMLGFQIPSLSPGAQDVMLYSPYSNNDGSRDEGYEDFVSDTGKPDNDFALFDSSARPRAYAGSVENRHMFQDLSTLVPSAWSGRGTDLAQQLGVSELMMIDDE